MTTVTKSTIHFVNDQFFHIKQRTEKRIRDGNEDVSRTYVIHLNCPFCSEDIVSEYSNELYEHMTDCGQKSDISIKDLHRYMLKILENFTCLINEYIYSRELAFTHEEIGNQLTDTYIEECEKTNNLINKTH